MMADVGDTDLKYLLIKIQFNPKGYFRNFALLLFLPLFQSDKKRIEMSTVFM
jgi:hypothetical protein